MLDCVLKHPIEFTETSNQEEILECPVCCNSDRLVVVDRLLISNKPDQDHPYGLKIAQCNNCQHQYQTLVWSKKQLTQYYHSDTAYYRSDYSQNIPKSSLVRFDSVLDDLKPLIRKDWRHLDVGGYAAHFSYFMAQFLRESHCLDVSNYLPSNSVENVKIIQGALSEFDSRGKQYDLISLNHVLEHLTDLQTVRKTLWKLLKPGGILLIEVPDDLAITESMLDYTLDHTQYFTGNSLFRFLDDKFHIKSFRHFQYQKSVDVGQSLIYRVLAQKKTESLGNSIETKQLHVENIIKQIESRIKDSSRIYVWGSGYHTRLLFSMSEAVYQKTCNLIDSDSTREGKTVFGKTVVHPSKLSFQKDFPVVISSFDYRKEIDRSARSFFPGESVINPYNL